MPKRELDWITRHALRRRISESRAARPSVSSPSGQPWASTSTDRGRLQVESPLLPLASRSAVRRLRCAQGARSRCGPTAETAGAGRTPIRSSGSPSGSGVVGERCSNCQAPRRAARRYRRPGAARRQAEGSTPRLLHRGRIRRSGGEIRPGRGRAAGAPAPFGRDHWRGAHDAAKTFAGSRTVLPRSRGSRWPSAFKLPARRLRSRRSWGGEHQPGEHVKRLPALHPERARLVNQPFCAPIPIPSLALRSAAA